MLVRGPAWSLLLQISSALDPWDKLPEAGPYSRQLASSHQEGFEGLQAFEVFATWLAVAVCKAMAPTWYLKYLYTALYVSVPETAGSWRPRDADDSCRSDTPEITDRFRSGTFHRVWRCRTCTANKRSCKSAGINYLITSFTFG